MRVSLSCFPSEYSAHKCMGMAYRWTHSSCQVDTITWAIQIWRSNYGTWFWANLTFLNHCQQVETDYSDYRKSWEITPFRDVNTPQGAERGCAQEAANCWQTKRNSRGRWTARHCCTPLPLKGTLLLWIPMGTGSIPQAIHNNPDVLLCMRTCKCYAWKCIYIYKSICKYSCI